MSQRLLDFKELLSREKPTWLGGHTKVMLRGYNVRRVNKEDIDGTIRLLRLKGALGVCFFGQVNFYVHVDSDVNPESLYRPETLIGTHRIDVPGLSRFLSIQKRQTSQGVFLILISAYDSDQPALEQAARYYLQETAGLLNAAFGRNITFEHVFDNVLNIETGALSITSPYLVNPDSFPAPDTSEAGFQATEALEAGIDGLGSNEATRVRLSLQWFEMAVKADDHNSFLACWIAIEILIMPDTNIRPAEEALATIYSLTLAQTKEKFKLGRIFGIRSNMVHNGIIPSLHTDLIDYLQAVYVDLLLYTAGRNSEFRAAAVLNKQGFDLASYL